MPLDKDLNTFLTEYHAKQLPPYSSFTPRDLRQWINDAFYNKSHPKKIEVARVIEQSIPGPASQLNCRIYYPEGTGPFPALMYFHGGGFVIRDDLNLYDQTCRMMCQGAECVVISVDYRLAPENPFPAAPEDCYAATCWVAEHANELNIDANRFGVWGESCGGTLATVIAMMSRDRGGPNLICQIIVTPMLEYDFTTQSYRENGQGEYILTVDTMKWFWNHYISKQSDLMNPYCAPCTATNLKQLPAALVITVEYDPLRDEGAKYAQQLKSAGVETQYTCYPGLIHTFFDFYSISEATNQACQDIIASAKKLLASR